MEREQLKGIISAFPIQVSSIEKIKKNLYKLHGKKRSYCLKYYAKDSQLEEMTSILDHLQQCGFQKCYRLIFTHSHKPYFKPAHNEKGGWQVTTWITGSRPNFVDHRQLRDALTLLADFHQHAEHVPFTGDSAGRYETVLEQWKIRNRDLTKWKKIYNNPKMEKAVELSAKSMDALIKSPLPELIYQEKQLQTVVHGDYNYPNLVRQRNDGMLMIDFENAAHDVRIRDLAHIIQRNVHSDINKAKQLLGVYEQVRPLTSEERAVLSALIAFPYQFWRMIHIQRYHHKPVTQEQLNRWGKKYLSRQYTMYWCR